MPEALVAEPIPGASERLRMVYANFAPEQRIAARQQIQALIGTGGLAVSLLLALAAASGPAARIMRTPPAEAVRQSA